MTILPFDTKLYDKEINTIGNTVTIRTVTDDSYSKWGDATESTSDATGVKTKVNILTSDDEWVKEGKFQSGDIECWFDVDRTDITRGNRIQFNSEWFQIDEVVKNIDSDSIIGLRCGAKKV